MKRIFFTAVIPLFALAASCSSESEQLYLYDLSSYIPVHSDSDDSYTYFDLSTGKKAKNAKNYDAADYFYDGIAVISEEGDEGERFCFINSKFKPISKEKYTSVTSFNDGYAWVAQKNEPIKAIKKDGTTAFTLQNANKANVFNDGVAVFGVIEDADEGSWGTTYTYKYGLVNTSGKVLIKPGEFFTLSPYGYNNMIKAGISTKKGIRYGIVDYNGKEIIPFEYEDIDFNVLTAKNKTFPVETSRGWGVVNIKNKEVIEPIYDQIRPQMNGNYICSRLNKIGYGYISAAGKELIPPTYYIMNDFTYGNHTAACGEESLMGIIDESGDFIVRPKFVYIREFDDNGLAVFHNGERFGLLDSDGNIIVSDKFDYLLYLGEGLYIAKIEGNSGLITSKGKTIINFSGDYSPKLDYNVEDHTRDYDHAINHKKTIYD